MKKIIAALFLCASAAVSADSVVGYEQEWFRYPDSAVSGALENRHFFVKGLSPLTFTEDLSEAHVFADAGEGLLLLETEAPARCYERYRKNGKFYRHCFSADRGIAQKLWGTR